MKDKTPTNANTALSTKKPTKDVNAKEILKDKQIAALILKECWPEDFKDIPLQEMVKHIGGITNIALYEAQSPADPDKKTNSSYDPGSIQTLDSELLDSSGRVSLDVLYKWKHHTKQYLINMELQNEFKPDVIAGRMVYYLARVISHQKNREFTKDNYQNLLPVKQIWIFPHWISKSGLMEFAFKTIRQEHFDEKTAEVLKQLIESFITSCFVFLNAEDYNQFEGSIIETLGQIFINDERDAAIEFLEAKKGVIMTVQLRKAMQDYIYHPNTSYETRLELEAALAEKDEALAEKDEALAEKDEALAKSAEALTEKDAAFVTYMLQDPRNSISQIAEQVGVSVGFVKSVIEQIKADNKAVQ